MVNDGATSHLSVNLEISSPFPSSTHLVPEPVGGKVAAVLVADAVVPLVARVVAALLALAIFAAVVIQV